MNYSPIVASPDGKFDIAINLTNRLGHRYVFLLSAIETLELLRFCDPDGPTTLTVGEYADTLLFVRYATGEFNIYRGDRYQNTYLTGGTPTDLAELGDWITRYLAAARAAA